MTDLNPEQVRLHALSLADKLRRAAEEGQSPWTDEGTCLVFADAAKTLDGISDVLLARGEALAAAQQALQRIVHCEYSVSSNAERDLRTIKNIARAALASLSSPIQDAAPVRNRSFANAKVGGVGNEPRAGAALPTTKDILGLVPDMTGGLSAEEHVRRLRDDEPLSSPTTEEET